MSLLTTLNFIACAMVLMGVWRRWMQKQEVLKLPKIDFVYFLVAGCIVFMLSYAAHYFLIFYSKKYLSLFNEEKQNRNGLLSKYYIISSLVIPK